MIKQTCFKIGTCILLILLIFQILPQASTGASASSAALFVTILSPAMADTFGVYENVFLQGTSITISAEASSSEGISQMVIMDGDMAIKAFRVSEGTLGNNSNTSKISWNWTNASPGEHTITVRAYSAVTNIRSTDWTYIVVTPAVEIDEVYIGDSTAPLDGEFENYTDTTGNVLPTGWGGDTFYADGGRILAGSPGRNSSSCLYMATTDSTKNISPYIQAGNYSGLSGTLVFEMDIMRGSESNSVDLRTIVTGYVAGSSTAQILFFMKRGTFQAALDNGWLVNEEGILPKEINPEAYLTREDMAVIFIRAVEGYQPENEEAGEDDEENSEELETTVEELPALSFKDVADISPHAIESIWLAVQGGLIQGFPDGSFRPKDICTRAEVAVIIERILNR